jgi:UrcA family protein
MNTRILLGLALSFAIGSAAQAATESISDSGVISVAVRTSDLDLARADGAKALLNRLRHAAALACGGRPSSPLDLAGMQAYGACVRTSLDGAVGQVHAPLVAALYRGHDQAVASAGGPG